MVLIAGGRLGRAQAERGGGVGIAGEEPGGHEVVDLRGLTPSREHGLAREIQRLGICREIVIEGDVLLKNNDEVLDRGLGPARARILLVGSCRDRDRPADEQHHDGQRCDGTLQSAGHRFWWSHARSSTLKCIALVTDTAGASAGISAERYSVMSAM